MIYMQTISGRRFNLKEPNPADVSIDEIALSLSRINRFLGHTREPYTVAEHCVRVSRLIEHLMHSQELQLRGLLHDAAEAYTGDITAPMKQVIREQGYRLDVTEDRIERAILASVGLQHIRSKPALSMAVHETYANVIKWADRTMLATELRDHMGVPESELPCPPQPKRLAVPLTAVAAERSFLERFEELRG